MRAFISFEAKDGNFIAKFFSDLIDQEITPITVNLRALYGETIIEGGSALLSNLSRVIIVLSKHYTQSKWMKKELEAILKWEKADQNNILILIKIDDCSVPPKLLGRTYVDFSGNNYDAALSEVSETTFKGRRIFVIMKLDDEALQSMYEGVVVPVIQEFRYTHVRIDELPLPGKINDQILEYISNSELVYADLTKSCPNCFFEVGYAYALKKKMILSMNKSQMPIPFDLSANRFILWTHENDLRKELRKHLKYFSLTM